MGAGAWMFADCPLCEQQVSAYIFLTQTDLESQQFAKRALLDRHILGACPGRN